MSQPHEQLPNHRTIQEKTRDIMPSGLNAPVSPIKPTKRFNELDVKILEDTAGVELDEIAFKLEVKMNAINKEIELIDEQIRLFLIINPKDKDAKLRELLMKKGECEQILAQVKEEYQNLGDFYKMSNKIADKIEQWQQKLKENTFNFAQTPIGKWFFGIAPFFKSRKYLGTTVGKLDTLYKRMEHIVNLRHIPYGEKEETMGDLIEFMKTANQLEANLHSFFVYQKTVAQNGRTSKTQ
jgi:DNA polymerase III delta prime subunit